MSQSTIGQFKKITKKGASLSRKWAKKEEGYLLNGDAFRASR
jgi:hypothetical protein